MAKAKMPSKISPMLCTLTKEPINHPDYIYEMKWDGYRIISIKQARKIVMSSRSGLDYTAKYPPVASAINKLDHEVILDGEVVVFNEAGRPDFDALQLYNGHSSPIKYCVFDLLWLDGADLSKLPLEQRKNLLKALVENDDIFYFSESYPDGDALYQMAKDHNLEGVVAKDKTSPYIQGGRTSAWLKIPTRKRQEFVIGGWAESDKSRSFKSLLFGAYEKGKLQWIGRSGGGYKQAEMPGILKQLLEIETEKSPFENKVLDTKGAKTHWVKPVLVANFEFATWTKSRRIRKPATFLGFRKDKSPKDVVLEVPEETEAIQALIEQQQEPGAQNQETPSLKAQNKENAKAKKTKDKNADLVKYHEKRSFDITPEPEGGSPESDQLLFVVQKHDASHLHYDFRLEMRGVLKSWAVPKGPSMNPKDHRLAMAVEDHPYDYKDFEGIIPEGEYGGGTVMVWDNGTFEPAEPIKGKEEQQRWLLSHYYKNKLSIILHGKKLKGKFNLVKTYGETENAWLLTKVKDGHELQSDITKKDQSVRSGLTILEIAMDSHAKVWQSNRATEKPAASKTNPAEAELEAELTGPEILDQSGSDREEQQDTIKHGKVGELFPRSENKRSTRSKTSAESNWNNIFEEKIKSEGSITIEGQPLQLTNIEKKLWNTTNKAQLIAYYNTVAQYLLPHLKDRPLSLHIKNLNAGAPGFYIKDMEGFQPAFLDIHATKRKHKVKGKPEIIDYAVCNNLPALLWLINLGCIDLNPWNSTAKNPQQPDYIAIDLDPSDEDFKKVIKTALAAKAYFQEQKLSTFIKTSGKTGIHIFIPCKDFSYPQARTLAERICKDIHKRVPMFTTTEVSIDKRGNMLFVDFSQNDEADTLASVYSVRPVKRPTVSAPIDWDELQPGLEPYDFTIENMAQRLSEKGDLWKNLHEEKIKTANSKVLKKLLESQD
jgi:bifunctional non-homologous end joining protein LigD